MDLFKELLPSLLETRTPVITVDNENEYQPFICNRAISQHIDCLMYANEMNKLSGLDKKLQYDFYFHSLQKKKRKFQKWAKAVGESNDIQNVKEYFGYSSEKAKESLRILSREQLDNIASVVNKGGTVK